MAAIACVQAKLAVSVLASTIVNVRAHKLTYKLLTKDHTFSLVLYGGVDPTDENQITRMKDILEKTYMRLFIAYVGKKPGSGSSESEDNSKRREDKTLHFGPHKFKVCEENSDEAWSFMRGISHWPARWVITAPALSN